MGGRGLRLEGLMGMLRMAIALLPQVFICIDALDECLPKHLPELLESLRDIVRESPMVRIFLTGRPYVGEDIHRYFPKAAAIPLSPKTDDIKNYLQMRLGMDLVAQAMDNTLRADIIQTILERIPTCVAVFLPSTQSMEYAYQILCVGPPRFAKHRHYSRRDDNSSEKKETWRDAEREWTKRCLYGNSNTSQEGTGGK